MKGIIFAAGLGSRLRPITDKTPKPLVKINDKEILSFILDAFEKGGIKNVIICMGYKKETIKNFCRDYRKLNFTFIENKKFNISNNLYSLYLAKNFLDDDLILIDGDTILHPRIVNELSEQKLTSLVRDKGEFFKKSMNLEIGNGQKVKLSENILTELKNDNDSTTIIKIAKKDAKKIKQELEYMIEKEKKLNNSVFTIISKLFRKKILEAQVYNISHKYWYEIDTITDLKRTEEELKKSSSPFHFKVDR